MGSVTVGFRHVPVHCTSSAWKKELRSSGYQVLHFRESRGGKQERHAGFLVIPKNREKSRDTKDTLLSLIPPDPQNENLPRVQNFCLLFSGVTSFCVCYYYGLVTSDRGLDLMRWILKSIGLLLLYRISLSLVVIVFLLYTICSSGIVLYFVRLILRRW